MSRQSVGDYIEQYAVKVIYKKYNIREGSGFLVKINEATIYLFTVKHNFKIEDDDEHTDVDINELKNSSNSSSISACMSLYVFIITQTFFAISLF